LLQQSASGLGIDQNLQRHRESASAAASAANVQSTPPLFRAPLRRIVETITPQRDRRTIKPTITIAAISIELMRCNT